MKHFNIFLSLYLILAYSLIGQANEHLIKFSNAGNINLANEKKTYLLVNNLSYVYNHQKTEFETNHSWIYSMESTNLKNNDYTGNVFGNYFLDTNKRWNAWILGGFKSLYSLNIMNEIQAGLGIAYKLLDDEKNGFLYFRVSNGLIYEYSEFKDNEAQKMNYAYLRNSLRIQSSLSLFKSNDDKGNAIHRIKLIGNYMWQPAINKANDYNLIINAGLLFALNKYLSLETKYTYNYVSRTAKESALFSYGIGMNISL